MICNNVLEKEEIMDSISEIAVLNIALAINLFLGSDEIIEELAKYKHMIDKIIVLRTKLEEGFKVSIFCELVKRFKLEEEINKVVADIESMLIEFKLLDEEVNNLSFDTFEEIEASVSNAVEKFEEKKLLIKEEIDKKIKMIFQLLVEIGAEQSDIDRAFEKVEFEDNPFDYIQNLFAQILDEVLVRISEED